MHPSGFSDGESLTAILNRYEMSAQWGFLLNCPPLEKLPAAYEPWEVVVRRLPEIIRSKSENVKGHVDMIPTLDASTLTSRAELYRGYNILSFLLQAYVSENISCKILPECLSMPLENLSYRLGLPPVATYTTYTLANLYGHIDPKEILNQAKVMHTFTGSNEETFLYLGSAVIEVVGAQGIVAILKAVNSLCSGDKKEVIINLEHLATSMRQIPPLLREIPKRCPPQSFSKIRPFLAGILYPGGENEVSSRKYLNGSNAQASLLQTFDIFLGVTHSSEDIQHFAELRDYMPKGHRDFLMYLVKLQHDSRTNLRGYVKDHAADLRDPYNKCLNTLKAVRDAHWHMVTRYFPSRIGNSGINSKLDRLQRISQATSNARL